MVTIGEFYTSFPTTINIPRNKKTCLEFYDVGLSENVECDMVNGLIRVLHDGFFSFFIKANIKGKSNITFYTYVNNIETKVIGQIYDDIFCTAGVLKLKAGDDVRIKVSSKSYMVDSITLDVGSLFFVKGI
tara:strand:- start:214 stop:606 length:393 start_codon:yes stop_codon:yes gene_type:complete